MDSTDSLNSINPIPPHTHNGIDSPKISINDILDNPADTSTDTSGANTFLFNEYFIQHLRPDVNLGWTVNAGTVTKRGNGLILFDSNKEADCSIDIANGNLASVYWDDGIDYRIGYLFSTRNASAGVSPAAAGDIWYFHGLQTGTGGAKFTGNITDLTRRIGFAHYNGKVYAVTCDASTILATEINAIDDSNKHHYAIDCTATSVKFYLDGPIVATHTTSIPTDHNAITLKMASYNESTSTGFAVSSIVFSETLN
jgi:hypothetical protein